MKSTLSAKSVLAQSRQDRPGPFHTVSETADYLGVSDRTVRRFIDAGHLLSHRIGRSVRISEADLRAYLARSR